MAELKQSNRKLQTFAPPTTLPAREETRPGTKALIARKSEKQAYQALQVGFTVAPIVAGADKFFNVLGNWDNYLAPVFPKTLGVSPRAFMRGVGAIEIAAGIGVAVKPKIFGYVVSGWLLGIIGNLLIRKDFYDVALRDLGLSIGAYSLAKLAKRFEAFEEAA